MTYVGVPPSSDAVGKDQVTRADVRPYDAVLCMLPGQLILGGLFVSSLELLELPVHNCIRHKIIVIFLLLTHLIR